MGPQELVSRSQSKDAMLRSEPEAQPKELGKGVGWTQSEEPGVRSQDESVAGNPGQIQIHRGRKQNRGQEEADSPLGRAP